MNDVTNLDELLSQPLPDVADNGFSDFVMARVKSEERRKAVAIALVCIASVTVLCLVVPLPLLTTAFGLGVVKLATSPMLAWAGAVLVLTLLVDRLFADRQLLQL